jgi:ATP-dependent Clp protease ATP-binding subunit ClpA
MTDKPNKAKYHKLFLQSLDHLFYTHRLNEDQLREVIASVSFLVNSGKFTSSSYKKFIVKFLVVNWENNSKTLLTAHGREGLSMADLISDLYEEIVKTYPVFEIDSIINAVNMHDFEESFKENPRHFLGISEACTSKKDFQDAEKKLKKVIIGQDEAIEKSLRFIKLIKANLEKNVSLFFIGPTGVGKTELSKQIAKVVYGSHNKILKINCGEYTQPHEYAKLLGSPPGYIGHDGGSILGRAADKSSEWVIVFDEIEKAHSKLHDVILNLLDEGEIMDSQGQMLDFTKSLIIFTSNVGMQDNIGKKQVGFLSNETTYEEVKERIDDAYKDKFSPEFRNRIDEVINFNQLTMEDARKIARIHLNKLPIKVTPKLVNHILQNGYSKEYGARNLKRAIRQSVGHEVADYILDGQKGISFEAIFNGKNFMGLSSL